MKLSELLLKLPAGWGSATATASDPQITGVAEDSRRVQPGSLFLARLGRGADGHRYIAAAVQSGAAAVAGELALDELPAAQRPPAGVPYLHVEHGREAFALFSAAFYDYPSRKMRVIGVTGTDGKTTTSTFTHRILAAAGIKTGLITTIAALIGDQSLDTGFHTTTPEAFDLQGYLAQMVEAGCTAAVVETTSHALDQARVAYVDYDVAAVTNVTHEHLDWHGSWEGYMTAKARLFDMLSTAERKPNQPKVAVVNMDDRSYEHLRDRAADQLWTYSLDPARGADFSASAISISRDGTSFTLHTPFGSTPARIRLLGRYNVANALAATAAAMALGAPLASVPTGLAAVAQVKGRMEWVDSSHGFDVVVDFAHTPNALEETLRLGHELTPKGRVIAVFGSAGLRDVAKRYMMGEVAGRLADLAVVTAEDPRTEDVNAINQQIAAGLIAHGRRENTDYWLIPDRAEAIAHAIDLARPGDIVVTCGKAHEQSMCWGKIEYPWDEFAAARAGLQSLDFDWYGDWELPEDLSTLSTLELHDVARHWNWDDGEEVLRQLVRLPQCDRGTALMIYWFGAPGWHKSHKDLEAPGYQLIVDIEQRYLGDFYQQRGIYFDPAHDRGHGMMGYDWTVRYADEPESDEHIPEIMFKPSV